MRLIAHRGFAECYPENSLVAVERAAENADVLEIDVRRCGSGELVVTHDAVFDSGERVRNLSVTELADSNENGGEGIATLETILDAIPSAVGVNVELKESDIVADALATTETIENEVIVSSFDVETLRTVRATDPDAALASIIDAGDEDGIESALSLDCAFVHPHTSLCLRTDIVENAHDAGMEVNAWTVGSRTVAWALEKRGVDGVIADSPDVL